MRILENWILDWLTDLNSKNFQKLRFVKILVFEKRKEKETNIVDFEFKFCEFKNQIFIHLKYIFYIYYSVYIIYRNYNII